MNQIKIKQLPAMAIAFACATVGVLTPDWRTELHAAGYGTYDNSSGVICKNYSPANAANIDYLTYGVTNSNRNRSRSGSNVICPLNRATTNTNGGTVNIFVNHLSNVTTSCTFYSYDLTGTLFGSSTASVSGNGLKNITISLGDGTSSANTNYIVTCLLPGSSQSVLTGVKLTEN
jgi:hypothetical protein